MSSALDRPAFLPASARRIITALTAHLPARWRSRAPVVAVLRLSGVIGIGSTLRPALNIADLGPLIERAFAAKRIRAVALVINSPGGSPAQSHLIMRRIRALADEKKVPVYAFVEDVAASGGYMIACAADEIIADPGSIIGSIGVVSASFGFDRLIERFGIQRRVHTAGRSKAMLDPFRPEQPDDVAHLKALQQELHAMFIGVVKASRGNRLTEGDDELFSGAFWLAEKAIALGLADSTGEVSDTLRRLYGDRLKLKEIAAPRGFLARRLAGRMHGLAGEALAILEERASWARFGL